MNAKINNRVREGSRLATIVLYAFSAFAVFITLYPMWYVLIQSLSSPRAALQGVYALPKDFNLDAYRTLIRDQNIWRFLLNTVMYASVNTALMLCTSILGAFPLTFKTLRGRKIINMYLLITMFFSGGLIPSFLLMLRLGIYNTPLSLIIPSCFSVWNIILTKSYFSTVPETLREAARIDGANVYQLLLRIYLPLAAPILAVIAVYTIVGNWNSWFNAMVYLPKLDWQPLQLYLRRILVLLQEFQDVDDVNIMREQAERQEFFAQLRYAMIIFTSLPVLFTYPFFQRYFMKGIMLGSLKE